MSQALPTIDFRGIRLHDGTQHGGFEQLTVDLFARQIGVTRQFVRVHGAGGDGGVEAFAEVPDKGKSGMQAKYFLQLKDKQWGQLEQSVNTALSEHPELREYHVFVPLDRTKGRKDKTKAGVEKWDDHVKRWRGLPNGKDVEFAL